ELQFGDLWYGDGEPNAVNNAVGYAMRRSRSHDVVINVYDDAGNVVQTHEHARERRMIDVVKTLLLKLVELLEGTLLATVILALPSLLSLVVCNLIFIGTNFLYNWIRTWW